MRDKNLRIFLGPCWYARIAATVGAALREKGLNVTVAAWSGALSRYPDAEYDVVLNFQNLKKWQKILKFLRYFWSFLFHHDAFIFLSGDTLLPYNLDLPILKLLHKKTIMWFIGSDIKNWEAVEAAARKVGFKYPVSKDKGMGPKALKRKLRMIQTIEKYVDYIISYPSISQLLTRKYNIVPIPLNIDSIEYRNVQNLRPLVVHSPTDLNIKGTSYVVKAVEQLRTEGYDFEFTLFHEASNAEVRETLAKADIAVDQLFTAGPGMFATEAMAAGCAVLGGNFPEFSGYPRELPVIHTDPDNIYDNLKMLLENPELRRELGEKGRKYVEKYHDSRKVADDILRLLDGNTEGLISYDPKD